MKEEGKDNYGYVLFGLKFRKRLRVPATGFCALAGIAQRCNFNEYIVVLDIDLVTIYKVTYIWLPEGSIDGLFRASW